MATIFDLKTRDPFCLVLTIKKFDALASSPQANGPGRRRWTSVFCASTQGCALDPGDYGQFLEQMTGLVSAYRALCGGFDHKAIAAVLDAMALQITGEVKRCVALEEVNCLCPWVWRLGRAKSLAHILIDVAWARGPNTPGADVLIQKLKNLALIATDLCEHLAEHDGGLRRFEGDDISPAARADGLAVDLFETVEQLSIAMEKQDA